MPPRPSSARRWSSAEYALQMLQLPYRQEFGESAGGINRVLPDDGRPIQFVPRSARLAIADEPNGPRLRRALLGAAVAGLPPQGGTRGTRALPAIRACSSRSTSRARRRAGRDRRARRRRADDCCAAQARRDGRRHVSRGAAVHRGAARARRLPALGAARRADAGCQAPDAPRAAEAARAARTAGSSSASSDEAPRAQRPGSRGRARAPVPLADWREETDEPPRARRRTLTPAS